MKMFYRRLAGCRECCYDIMKISLEWLNDFIDPDLSPARMMEALEEIGLSIEGWRDTDQGVVLDALPQFNRPDLMGHLGLRGSWPQSWIFLSRKMIGARWREMIPPQGRWLSRCGRRNSARDIRGSSSRE